MAACIIFMKMRYLIICPGRTLSATLCR